MALPAPAGRRGSGPQPAPAPDARSAARGPRRPVPRRRRRRRPIYGFNGSDPALLLEVERRFPGVEVVRLPANHRCTPQIVDAGVHVLARSDQRADLRFGAARRRRRPDRAPTTTSRPRRSAVARTIARLDPSLVRSEPRRRAGTHERSAATDRPRPRRARCRRPSVGARCRLTPAAGAGAGVPARRRAAAAELGAGRARGRRRRQQPVDTPNAMVGRAVLDFLRAQPGRRRRRVSGVGRRHRPVRAVDARASSC